MEIIFLGTAAATSYPLVFCRCENCEKARLIKGKSIRKRSSILIDDEMLVDLGPDFVTSMDMYKKDITKIKYLLQTHPHSDHFDAGHFVTRWSEYATINVPNLKIVASHECFLKISEMIQNNENIDIFNSDWQKDLNIDLLEVNHADKIKLGDYVVTAIESLHDVSQGSLCFLIEKDNKTILYATDVIEFSDKVMDFLHNKHIDCLILDHTYGLTQNHGGHLNEKLFIEQTNKLKENNSLSGKSKIFATHISHEGCPVHEEMEKIANGKYEIAYDGLVINI